MIELDNLKCSTLAGKLLLSHLNYSQYMKGSDYPDNPDDMMEWQEDWERIFVSSFSKPINLKFMVKKVYT